MTTTAEPTDEERRLFAVLVTGVTDEVAGLKLGLTRPMVRRRVRAAMHKLGARSRIQAGYLAAVHGWVDGARLARSPKSHFVRTPGEGAGRPAANLPDATRGAPAEPVSGGQEARRVQ